MKSKGPEQIEKRRKFLLTAASPEDDEENQLKDVKEEDQAGITE